MPVAFNPWFLVVGALLWLTVLAAVWLRRDLRTPDRSGKRELTTFGGIMGGLALGSALAAGLLLIVALQPEARPFGGVTIPLEILAALWLIFAAVTLGSFVARRRRVERPADWRRVKCEVEEKIPTPHAFPYLFRYTVDGIQRSFLQTRSYQLQDLEDQWVWVNVKQPGEIRDGVLGSPRPSGPFLRNLAWIAPGIVVLALTLPMLILLLVWGAAA